MNDIFISYANADRAVAQSLADALDALGWSVWWDREILFGQPFDHAIEEQLNRARCVIVLWSPASVNSRWVKTEAAAAADRDRLIPVLIEDVPIPFEFKRIQTAMLPGWRGDREQPEFVRLVESVRHMLEQPARPQRGQAPARSTVAGSPWWRLKWAGGGAALLLVIVALIIARPGSRPTESSSPQTSSDAPSDATRQEKATRTDTASAPSREPPGAAAKGFAIMIGERIADGVPAVGAGHIETPGAKDVYRFQAKAGQRVYFRMIEHGIGMSQIKWTLTDAEGAEVFDTCLGCGEPGLHVLNRPGTYTLTVGSNSDPATGAYRLQLFDVPPPHSFATRIGDPIKENAPGPGAGSIEVPGTLDLYSFTAAAGQRVYVRVFEYDKGMTQIGLKLTDGEGAEIFNTCLGCGEPGAHTLKKAGTYTLAVGALRVPAVGVYRMQVLNVPPPARFPIRIGDTIKENSPGPGAGEIEAPGSHDVYTFNAAAGQHVFFRMIEHGKGMEQIKWKLTDSDGTAIFDTCLGCVQPGVNTLKKGGPYTMSVGADRNDATGPYRLQLSAVPGG